MDGLVQIDEFVVSGQEQGELDRSYNSKKKKAIMVVQLTEEGKMKRMYIQKIRGFSAQSLQYIFIKHIDKQAQVMIDKRRGYKPIAKAWGVTQKESDGGKNFITLHT